MDAERWDEIVVLQARVEQEVGTALQRRHGISLSDYRALRRLAEAPGRELRMQDLAALTGLSQSAVSRLIVRLETAGLARRDLCPDDRRGVYGVITDDGLHRREEARATYQTALSEALAEAAADPAFASVATGLGHGGPDG
jgi:DNA-binding MarR family transcriptional regulator